MKKKIVKFFYHIETSFILLAGTNLLLQIWKTRSAVPLNLVHFGFAFGAILVNLLVRPFMNNANSYRNTTHVFSQSNPTLSRLPSVLVYWDIRVPYLITGALSFVIGIGYLIFFIREQNNKQNKCEKPKASY